MSSPVTIPPKILFYKSKLYKSLSLNDINKYISMETSMDISRYSLKML